MVDIWVLEVNALLELARSFRMTDDEVKRSESLDEPIDQAGYYQRAQLVLEWRSANFDVSAASDLLIQLAKEDGITLERPMLSVPVVNVPFYGGGL